MPNIPFDVDQAGWGSTKIYDDGDLDGTYDPTYVIIHWGGGTSERLTDDLAFDTLRGWQRYHLGRGWQDIAYNYAVTEQGTICRLRGANHGGHTKGIDPDTGKSWSTVGIGVVWVGGLADASGPSAAARAAMRRIVDAAGLPVFGHQEVVATQCPGNDWVTWADEYSPGPPPTASAVSGVALRTGEPYTRWHAGLSASWNIPEPHTHWAELMYDQGTIPVVHLMIPDTIQNIANGFWDFQLLDWLEALKRYQDSGRRAIIALLPEFNGNWTAYGQEWEPDRGTFKFVYRKIVTMGRAVGLTPDHIRWMWAPNDKGFPDDKLEWWYPRDDVVDFVGGSCYNWGGIVPGKPWLSPAQVIDPFVREVRTFTTKPIIITQTGSGLNDARSPQWLADLAAYAAREDRPFIYFNIDEFEYGPGMHDFNDKVEFLDQGRPDHWFDTYVPPTQPPTPEEYQMRTVKRGDGYNSKGTSHLKSAVIAAQGMLRFHGFADQNTSDPRCGADGIFGPGTEAAVNAFQADRGITVDGVVGDVTWSQLDQ